MKEQTRKIVTFGLVLLISFLVVQTSMNMRFYRFFSNFASRHHLGQK
jgi:hypothetical protein